MKFISAAALAGGLMFGSAIASADSFTLTNDNGGDGFVNTSAGGFDLFGSNNGTLPHLISNNTDYVATASSNETLSLHWSYTTNDCCGSFWDPAGYIVNGVRTQLSIDSDPSLITPGVFNSSGTLLLSLLAGDTYGFYVFSADSISGRADIAVTGLATTPVPAALPLFASALAGLGFLGWRRKKEATAA